jgi:Family of unknown function (DUF6029)
MRRCAAKLFLLAAPLAALSTWATAARAIDLPPLWDKPLTLDVTETSVVAQHFDARTGEGERTIDQGYGAWVNRLNLALKSGRWTLGMRLDSSLYWRRPEDRGDIDPRDLPTVQADGASRFRDAIYPAKLWVNYTAPGLEVTVGDAYVQFGRGLVLSMRKIDELGVDTTLRGAKVAWQADPFAATVVAGIANPTRVDEATGRALFLPKTTATDTRGPQPLIGSDRVIGAEIQAGRGSPVVLTTHGVRITRCAPYHYNSDGSIDDSTFATPLGSCDPQDTRTWLSTLPSSGATITASEIDMVGQGIEFPNVFGHGKIYIEGAVQHRFHDAQPDDPHANGNALYASINADVGPLTNTLELKSYRNFWSAAGSVRATELDNTRYTTPPTAELVTQDAELGNFNVCVNGGRLRSNVRLSEGLLVYGAGGYFRSQSEVAGGSCDRDGKTLAAGKTADEVITHVFDGLSGIEWNFDHAQSHLYASGGVRNDVRADDVFFYRELHAEYAFTKSISGPYAIELTGRHRMRKQDSENVRVSDATGHYAEAPWHEGEHYTALKVAPHWVFSQGFEYTTLVGFPTYYFNGSVLYRMSMGSNLKLLVGQQRGGLKCVSGVCKVFPAFEGVRAEVTLRF